MGLLVDLFSDAPGADSEEEEQHLFMLFKGFAGSGEGELRDRLEPMSAHASEVLASFSLKRGNSAATKMQRKLPTQRLDNA